MSMQTREQMLFDLERKAYLDLIAQARAEGERAGLERAAQTAYRVCAETRHVSLGDKVAEEIRALKVEGETP